MFNRWTDRTRELCRRQIREDVLDQTADGFDHAEIDGSPIEFGLWMRDEDGRIALSDAREYVADKIADAVSKGIDCSVCLWWTDGGWEEPPGGDWCEYEAEDCLFDAAEELGEVPSEYWEETA